MTSIDSTVEAILYDLARIECIPRHPELATEGLDPSDPSDQELLEDLHASLDSAMEGYQIQLQDALEERAEAIREQEEVYEDIPESRPRYLEDPELAVLDEISDVTAQMGRLQQRLSLLVAYAREFTADPPRQADIAAAANVSRTQVSRMYGDREVDLLTRHLGLQSPRAARQALRQRDDVPSRA